MAAKLIKAAQKLFASSAPVGEIRKVGGLVEADLTPTTDAKLIQSLASYLGGWFGLVVGQNAASLQDRNSLDYLFSRQIAYGFQMGVPEWDDETEYFIDSLVLSGGVLYQSRTDNNVNNAVTDTANWKKYSSDPTGTMKQFLGSTLPDGYVLASGRTIGNAASGGTERAHADTEALFTMLWNDYSDALLPVSGGRGANAAADFAANKTIQVPDMRGRVPAGKDNMGGNDANRLTVLDGNTLGQSGGAETHQLSVAEMPSHDHGGGDHSHGVTDPEHQHAEAGQNGANPWGTIAVTNPAPGTYTGVGGPANPTTATRAAATGISINNSGAIVASEGGDGSHNNVQPTMVVNYIIKL